MRIVLILIGMLLLATSCTHFPLKTVPLGASIYSYVINERQQRIDYISTRQNGGVITNIDDHPVFTPDVQINNWEISISTKLKGVTDFEMLELWTRQYENVMRVLASNIRPSSYEITVVPLTLTYRSQLKRKYTGSLLPISFVFSVPIDSTSRTAFQRVFSTLSHEQYHIHQKLDMKDLPVDRISSETLAEFVASCVSNMIFSEVLELGKNVPSIGDYIRKNPTREELRTAMAINAATKDSLQNNFAGKLVVRYLFDIMMEKPTKDPDEFSTELNKLCHEFGANTPTTWEGLLNLYTATKS